MKTIYNKLTNKVVSVEPDFQETEEFGVTDLLCTENFLTTNFNPITNQFYEGATPEEIAAATKEVVPLSVSRMGLKLQLLEKGIQISEIIETINSIPEYMFPEIEKKKAIIKFEEAAYFDRYNADLQLVAVLMGLSQEDLDDIFINGNKV